jgi:serine/threonine protein kinase
MSDNSEPKVIGNSNEWINWIEESIARKQIKYYDYKHFKNIQEIGLGSFGKVYRANWKNLYSYLVLKSFMNFNIMAKEIVEYADNSTLRNYLSERFDNLTWNNKLNLAFQLANAISCLHDKEIVHHDLVCYLQLIKLCFKIIYLT